MKYKLCCNRLVLDKRNVDEFGFQSETVPQELEFIDEIPGGGFHDYIAAAKTDVSTLKNPDFWLELGASVGVLGFSNQAIRCFEKVIDIDPNDHAARLNLAATLSVIDQHDEALNQIEKVPTDTDGRSLILANVLADQGDELEAIPHYERAIFEDPGFDLPYARLLTILEEIKHPSYEYWIDQSARMLPTSPWVAYFWARDRLNDGKMEELANAVWFDDLEVEADDRVFGLPDNASEATRAQLIRQIAIASLNPNRELIETLAKQISSFDSTLHFCDEGKILAILCTNQGYSEFISPLFNRVCQHCLDQGVGGVPQSVNTLLANSHLVTKDYAKAVEYSEKVLEENPQSNEVLPIYYWSLDEVGRKDEAIAIAKQLYEIRSDFPHLANNLGLMCMNVGLLGEAQYYYERQADYEPHLHSQGSLIFLHLLQQQPEKAEQALQKSFEMMRNREIARNFIQTNLEYIGPWTDEDHNREEVREAVAGAAALDFSDDAWEEIVNPLIESRRQVFDAMVKFSLDNKNSQTFATDLIAFNRSFGEDSIGPDHITIKPEPYSISKVLESIGHEMDESTYQSRFLMRLERSGDYSIFDKSLNQAIRDFDGLPLNTRTSLLEGERRYLADSPMLDYSPAVVSFAKAVEISILERVLTPYKELCNVELITSTEIEFSQGKRNSQATTLFNFLEKNHHLELGSMAHIFRLCMGRTADREPLVGRLRDFINQELGCLNLLAESTVESIALIAGKYRNPGAHSEILVREDLEECRLLCFGVLNSLLR